MNSILTKTNPLPEDPAEREECKKARAKAMRLLEHMDRTEKALYDKLRQADFSERAIADAMAYVSSYGYINDSRYAEVYLRNRVENKSRQQLMQELMRKGVDYQTACEAWENVTVDEEPDERSMIREQMLKKCQPDTEIDEKTWRRLMGYFARRGFHTGDVTSVMNELGITIQRERYYD